MVRRNVPLAEQVILEIVSGIESGELVSASGLLPSEAELSQRFRVSRGTVREALAKLELAGVIIRRQGSGTYVNRLASSRPASIQYWFDEAAGFMDLLRSSGHPAERILLDVSVQSAGPLAKHLRVDSEAAVLSVERLFLSASAPVIHCLNVIPLSLVDQAKQDTAVEDFRNSESVYHFLDHYFGRRMDHQQSEAQAVAADERLAELLRCEVGHPLLRLEEVGYDTELVPLFYGLNHFLSEAVSLVQVRKPAISFRGLGPT